MKHLIDALKVRHRERREVLEAIAAISDAVDSLPFEPFFEPVSVLSIRDGKPQLAVIGANDVAAWATHVAYASRARMRALEFPILREIHDGHLTASAALLRAHMETAALAAHAFLTVTDTAKSGDKERLDELMRKTYFGTSLFKETKDAPELKEYLDFSDQCTGRVRELVSSLDRFLEPDQPAGNRQLLRYALLCEYGHPNFRGMKGFSRVVEETEGGWFIQYTREEDVGRDGVQMVLEYLLENMRLGHAAAEFLRRTTFVEEDGHLRCYGPDPDEVSWIGRQIMRLK
jgi:hypothetical protein